MISCLSLAYTYIFEMAAIIDCFENIISNSLISQPITQKSEFDQVCTKSTCLFRNSGIVL